ncbi:hypothetical protein Clacol_009696 [Clathrus columnatus]|uniref:Uncharacterized protein n=1 Tax=Clathrus columnatus TaxID=1419009 RepID=A0AAV5ALC2_9AGAM|nr:hypothetical protein Clacol_009696 [Clathrus columnatus]
MRAVALNENSRLLYYGVIALFIGEITTGLVLYLISLLSNSLLLSAHLQPNFAAVVTFAKSQLSVAIFPKLSSITAFGQVAPALAFQCLLIPVIVPTIIRHRRTLKSRKKNGVVAIMIRDGIWGFLLNLIGVLVIIIEPVWLAGPLGTPNLQWSYLTFSVTSSRFLLNIRSDTGIPGVSGDMLLSSLYFNGGARNVEEGFRNIDELSIIDEVV